MTFIDQSQVRDMFNVIKYWVTAAALGLTIPILAFVAAVLSWIKCAQLWKVPEDSGDNLGTEMMAWDSVIDTTWLMSS